MDSHKGLRNHLLMPFAPCTAVLRDGSPCRSAALTGEPFCSAHTDLGPQSPEGDPWAELTPRDVQRLLADVSVRWWVAGGWALDVDGRRRHRDIDVAVLRSEHEALRQQLPEWDLRIAHNGKLRTWRRGAVGPPENAVWARPTSEDPWHIDFKIESIEGNEWVYRRDPTVRRPLDQIGHVSDGIPFLAPDIACLYKGDPGILD